MKSYQRDSRIAATTVFRGQLSINEPLEGRVALDLELLAECLLHGRVNLDVTIS